MGYKELINRLRYSRVCSDDIAEAATAIETLLEERDALMKDAIRCETCLHVKECYFNELRRIDCTQSNRGRWQWRGPKKVKNHD